MALIGSTYNGLGFIGGVRQIPVSRDLNDRLLMFIRQDPALSVVVDEMTKSGKAFTNLCDAISHTFSLDGDGEILDKLGAILQRPRPVGTDDTGYSILLRVQVEQILSSQAGIETILAICLAVTGNAAESFREFDFAEYQVGARSEDLETTELLLSLLKQATAAGVRFQLVEYREGVTYLRGALADGSAGSGVGDLEDGSLDDSFPSPIVHE